MERKNEELKVALSAARSSGADDVARAEAKVASATTEARAKIAAAERAAREAKAATDAAEAKAAAAEKARDDAVECLNVARAECEAEVKAAELRAANVEYDLETLRNRLRQSENAGKRALLCARGRPRSLAAKTRSSTLTNPTATFRANVCVYCI